MGNKNRVSYEVQTGNKNPMTLFSSGSYGEAFQVADRLSIRYKTLRILEINSENPKKDRIRAVWENARLRTL